MALTKTRFLKHDFPVHGNLLEDLIFLRACSEYLVGDGSANISNAVENLLEIAQASGDNLLRARMHKDRAFKKINVKTLQVAFN